MPHGDEFRIGRIDRATVRAVLKAMSRLQFSPEEHWAMRNFSRGPVLDSIASRIAAEADRFLLDERKLDEMSARAVAS